MLLPHNYAIYRGSFTAGLPAAFISLTALGVLSVGLWKLRERYPVPVLSLAWALLFLLPSLLLPNPEVINESRIYAAFGGMALLIAWVTQQIVILLERIQILQLSNRLQTALLKGTALLGIAALLIPATLARNRIWQDDILLWKEAARTDLADFHAYYNLGVALARKNKSSQAEKAFREATELNPRDDMSYAGLGYCCEVIQNWDCAAQWYKTALAINPSNEYAIQGFARINRKISSEGDQKP
jgi:tetratricopeptide (TPR) repeat protein